jgi:hypothetical protein
MVSYRRLRPDVAEGGADFWQGRGALSIRHPARVWLVWLRQRAGVDLRKECLASARPLLSDDGRKALAGLHLLRQKGAHEDCWDDDNLRRRGAEFVEARLDLDPAAGR